MYLASNFVALKGSLYQLVHGRDAMITVNDDVGAHQSFVALVHVPYFNWFSEDKDHPLPEAPAAMDRALARDLEAGSPSCMDYKTGLLALLFLSLPTSSSSSLNYRKFTGHRRRDRLASRPTAAPGGCAHALARSGAESRRQAASSAATASNVKGPVRFALLVERVGPSG